MPREKLYGGLLVLFSIMLLIYLTIANTNILLSDGVYVLYPYFMELFFQPFVYAVIPILIGEVIALGILMYIGYQKMNPPPPPELEALERVALNRTKKKTDERS